MKVFMNTSCCSDQRLLVACEVEQLGEHRDEVRDAGGAEVVEAGLDAEGAALIVDRNQRRGPSSRGSSSQAADSGSFEDLQAQIEKKIVCKQMRPPSCMPSSHHHRFPFSTALQHADDVHDDGGT